MEVPKTEYEEITEVQVNGHATVLEVFAKAVLEDTPMIADGCEGNEFAFYRQCGALFAEKRFQK